MDKSHMSTQQRISPGPFLLFLKAYKGLLREIKKELRCVPAYFYGITGT